MIISTKAGYRMWTGPYGDGGSRKYLLASLGQSLHRNARYASAAAMGIGCMSAPLIYVHPSAN
jgi:hypothetical protein